jgi:hypothetical protein
METAMAGARRAVSLLGILDLLFRFFGILLHNLIHTLGFFKRLALRRGYLRDRGRVVAGSEQQHNGEQDVFHGSSMRLGEKLAK